MDADRDLDEVTVIESLCINCEKQGVTRLLLTRIPYFRDIVVMSFACPHCHYRNSSLEPANGLTDHAVSYRLHVEVHKQPHDVVPDLILYTNAGEVKQDLNRQLIKSETATIRIPELDFEIPPLPQGEISTIEGILSRAAENLAGVLEEHGHLESQEKQDALRAVIERLREMAEGHESFTFILDDLAGNSFLENPLAPKADPRAFVDYRDRTDEETEQLGYHVQKQQEAQSSDKSSLATARQRMQGRVKVDARMAARVDTFFDVTARAAVMPGSCPSCFKDAETRMCITEIPHFKEVILMVTDCKSCGYRDSEVKPGSGISPNATKIVLQVRSQEDLTRDFLKSDHAAISIPEIELEMMEGTLGGKFTTVEGILCDILDSLANSHAFQLGDSALPEEASRVATFIERLRGLTTVSEPFTLIVDDAMGNSYIAAADGSTDPSSDDQLTVEHYTRTWEQDEELGLHQMQVDNYEADAIAEEAE